MIGNLVRLGRREEELDVRRRLLERLEQGVEGPRREHVHFVDVVDLVPGPAGPERGVLPQLAHLLDAVVAGPVDLDHVDVLPRGDRLARSQTWQGDSVGPFTQLRHLAKIRAIEVLPTPRVPQNR